MKMAGPSLSGIVGSMAGTAPGYTYSPAMKAYGEAWTPNLLMTFVANQKRTVPGTRCASRGLKSYTDGEHLSALLKNRPYSLWKSNQEWEHDVDE
jgi:cytochrome c